MCTRFNLLACGLPTIQPSPNALSPTMRMAPPSITNTLVPNMVALSPASSTTFLHSSFASPLCPALGLGTTCF